MSDLFYNEDSTNFFFSHDCTGGRGGAALDEYVDVLAGAGVTDLLCNTNAQRTNYDSDVWTPTWDGFDPGDPDDQPYLAGIPEAGRANWRRLATNMLALHEEGVDYPARFLARCRHHGVTPWITLRMNDVHDMADLEHPIHGRFWRQRPELWRTGADGYYARAFDFGHAEVRDYYMALVDETLERYDVDGLELDFLREPYLFSVGAEDAGRRLLTTWLGEIRQRVDASAERRGHRIALGVRSPSRPTVARAFGLDPVAWARDGLLDLLVVSPRWSTIEFDMPLREWRRLLADCETTLAGGLEILLGRHPTAPKRPVTAAEARGAAAQVLHDGADCAYLFNYFSSTDPESTPDGWTRNAYTETLASLADLPEISRHCRCHAITFVDMAGPESSEPTPCQLPATGAALELRLPTGPRPAAGTAGVTVDLEGESGERSAPGVTVNDGAPLAVAADAFEGVIRHLEYALPVADLVDGEANRIHVTRHDPPVTVVALDIHIRPG